MATLGSLVVTLEANIAKFQSDLGKAVGMAETSMAKIADAASMAKNAIEGLAGAFTLGSIVSFLGSVEKATSNLIGLSMQTGMSVAALSAVSVEAQRAGTDIDSVAGAFDRLIKNAASAEGGNKKTAAAFAAIGISAKDVEAGLKNPDALILEVAQHLEQFADDGNKVALTMLLMGRGGAQFNEVLHNLADNGYKNANVTLAQAEAAHAFEIQLANLHIGLAQIGRDVMGDLVPAFQGLLSWINDTFMPEWKYDFTWFAEFFSDIWTNIKYAPSIAFDYMLDKMNNFLTAVEQWGNKVATFFGMAAGSDWDDDKVGGESKLPAILAKRAAELHQAADVLDQAESAYNQSIPEAAMTQSWKHIDDQKKPSINLKKVEDTGGGGRDLIKEMEARLKVIDDAIKNEDAATKLGNAQLDLDYKNNILSLADYTAQKIDLLAKNNLAVQSSYVSEVQLGLTYFNQLTAMAAKETDVAKKRALNAEAAQALAKVQQSSEAMQLASIKTDEQKVLINKATQASQEALAKSYISTAIAFATLNGDTVTATALTIEQNDALLKRQYALNGNSVALAQLLALEDRQRLIASQNPWDALNVGVINYMDNIRNVGATIQQMTTQMLKSTEDAMVTFVTTGKLNWKGLIDSMIADMVRLTLEKEAVGILGMIFGNGLSGADNAAIGATANSATDIGLGAIPARAGGGAVTSGTPYTVGERGPETFVPNVGGTIVPHGGGGQGSIVYNPVIQIDARADRAQVQAETAQAVSQGNKELIQLLVRYNPGLRI